MSAAKGWSIIVAVLITLAGVFYFLQNITTGSASEFVIGTTTQQSAPAPAAPAREVPSGMKEYRSDQYHFSVLYPAELPSSESHDRGDAMTVSFQGQEGSTGFQIYVAPINGDKITADRFVLDEPSGVRREPKDIDIDGVPGISFYGFDAHVGETAEVWFIKDGFLYEVTTYKELASWLSDIMQSWQFTQ